MLLSEAPDKSCRETASERYIQTNNKVLLLIEKPEQTAEGQFAGEISAVTINKVFRMQVLRFEFE